LIRSQFHYYRNAMLHPPFWLSAGGRNTRIWANDSLGSSTTYHEIIVEDTYGMFEYYKHHQPSVIADIGANVGMFSKLCSLLFPDADIYSYEPNPDAFSWLEKNAEATGIKAYPCAVGARSGVVMLNAEYDSTIGLISPEGNIPVNCIAASEVAQGHQIDLLKMDCEGSEWSILQDTSLLRRTQYFCLEYHLSDDRTIQDLQELIEKAGHRILRLCPNSVYENKYGLLWSTRIASAS
jgi:FkbM family methyltransferase